MDKITAMQLAQSRANETRRPQGVYEHVGDYGRPGGDIAARHTYMVRALTATEPPRVYACVAMADPE